MSGTVKLISQEEFVAYVERLVSLGADYVDAVLTYCSERGIEIETAGAMIRNNQVLRSRIQVEAENTNVLPKIARLPID